MLPRLTSTFLAVLVTITAFCQTSAFQINKSGKGDPVLYLPGFACPGSIWNETVQHLQGNHTNYIVSYAGFNGIAPIQTPWYETIKKELLAYIVKENLTGLSVIGHSMGGMLALDLASEMPDRFKKLVIVDALPCLREVMMPGVKVEQITYDNPYNKQLLEMSPDAFNKTTGMIAASMTATKEKVDTIAGWMARADRRTYTHGYTDILKLDLRPSLSKIKASVLILGAPSPNKETVLVHYTKQYESLSNKTIEIAKDGQHFIMFDQPEWFYDQVNSFLSK